MEHDLKDPDALRAELANIQAQIEALKARRRQQEGMAQLETGKQLEALLRQEKTIEDTLESQKPA